MNDAETNLKTLIEAVDEMRRLQKEYFKTRDSSILASSKQQESHVDRLLKEFTTPQQPDLFS